MPAFSTQSFRVAPDYQPLMRMLGLDADAIFSDPRIKPWRRLSDRENCTLDGNIPDRGPIRLHVKRYAAVRDSTTPAEDEETGHRLLVERGIPTAPLVGWGTMSDGRSFVIFEDLAGFSPADKLVETGTEFQRLAHPTADLAATLHRLNLHHRDLYLCHFMARLGPERVELRLIDTARVRKLPSILTRGRWVVKDLAQFWYSTLRLNVTDAQRLGWLDRYAAQRGFPGAGSLRGAIESKVRRIARHDERLNRVEPYRNISIPE